MINRQSEFRLCPAIEPFSTKMTIPRHPRALDDRVKTIGVIRAENIPCSVLRAWIRSGFLHLALLSSPRRNVAGVGQILLATLRNSGNCCYSAYFIDQGERPDNGVKTVFAPQDQRILPAWRRRLLMRGLDFCSIGLNFRMGH